jgi:hypothetical protein
MKTPKHTNNVAYTFFRFNSAQQQCCCMFLLAGFERGAVPEAGSGNKIFFTNLKSPT